jgi:hypothetical protein
MNNHSSNDDGDNHNVRSWTNYLNIYINLFYLIFGNLGNLLKIAFFLQKPFRFLPCTAYILCATVSDFLTLNNLPVRQLLIHLYPKYHWIKVAVDWSNHRNESVLLAYPVSTYDLLMCKIQTYIHMFSIDVSSQMLVYASVNRFCFSYRRKKRHRHESLFIRLFCHYPNVKRLCLLSFVICAVLSLQHLFNFTIFSPSQGCVPRWNLLWTTWILAAHCGVSPMLMIVFGVLTLRNLRHSSMLVLCWCHRRRHRNQTGTHQFTQICSYCLRCRNSVQRQIENQLTSMITSEICMTVCTSLPYGIYAFHQLLYRESLANKNEWILVFIRMSMYLEASCGFYIYLLTLTSLRKRFCKMFSKRISFFHSCRNDRKK